MTATLVLALAAASASAADRTCQETTRFADGSVQVRTVPDEGGGASASAAGVGSGSSSSVSVSSSSGGTSRSSAQATGDHGRTVRVERDDRGCRIIIEQGER